ncbi:ParB N-terminal domain-containing protein [Streptomyces sp. AC495_CC817]|uniref:ParB N-terminal domain-containing protein n=1 Tax=Streptomyces sp. AC495_CC817 TaxID=2823900 RepID=UPI001C25E954|nr:ParB N-terminal domain-containing protein [Streptomyces sp. AC495_CC817]
MKTQRTVRFDHLIGVFAVGSGDWSWIEEYENLIREPETTGLMESIRADGIREPVLLGNDGRVWDGHHRIIVAMHLGLDAIPVKFSGHAGGRTGVVAEEPEWGTALRSPNGEVWDEFWHASRADAEREIAEDAADEHDPDEIVLVSRSRAVPAGPTEVAPVGARGHR